MLAAVKNPKKVKAGRANVAKRWAGHDPQEIRVSAKNLTPDQLRIVRTLIEAARSFEPTKVAAPSVIETSEGAAETRGTRDAVSS
jgi:hypothetical protein